MQDPPIPRERCPQHGFTLSPAGTCLECEEAASARSAGLTRAIFVTTSAVIGLLVVGMAVARSRVQPQTHGESPSTGLASSASASKAMVSERGVSLGDLPQSVTTSPETHAVLSAWQAELADAEAKRANELKVLEATRAAAEKKQIEDAYKLPARVASVFPERGEHGRVLTFPSDYGDHPWLDEEELRRHPPKDSYPEAAEALTMAPPAREFLIVPVRVFLMHSDNYPAMSVSPELAQSVPGIVEKTNRILAAAGVSLELKEVLVEEANDSGFEWSGPTDYASQALPDSHRVGQGIPSAGPATDGFRVYLIHDFSMNGFYRGHGEAIVKELSRSVPRVMAHEIGHGLGLGHVRTTSHVMASGAQGTGLSFAEAARMRSVALAWPGVHGIDPTNPPAAVLAVAGRALSR